MKGKAILIVNLIEDVAKVLKERTNLTHTISVHKQQDTDAIRNSLGHLSSLTGHLRIHKIFIGQDLVVKKGEGWHKTAPLHSLQNLNGLRVQPKFHSLLALLHCLPGKILRQVAPGNCTLTWQLPFLLPPAQSRPLTNWCPFSSILFLQSISPIIGTWVGN